jgi:hypothetical protein
MRRLKVVVLTALAVGLAASRLVSAQTACPPSCGEIPGWLVVNRVQLHIALQSQPAVPTEGLEGDWRFEMSGGEASDFRIDVNAHTGRESLAGTMIVIAGRVLAVQGLPIEGSAWENLEGHVLFLRLVRQLLGRAFPGGPRAVGRPSKINLLDDQRGFRVGGDNYLDIWPPWRVEGSAELLATGRVKFTMQLDYGTAERGETRATKRRIMRLAGEWVVDAGIPPLPDAMALVGWRIVPRGRPEGTFRVGASGRYATVGELRRALLP